MDEINLKSSNKFVDLSNLSICYTWKNTKLYKTNEFKISALTWNNKFELPDGSYSVSDNQDYFEYIFKKYWEKTENPLRIYINKIENRITFKTKTGYYLELLTPEKMKLLESTKGKITKDENGENVPHLEITEGLVHCSTVNNDYQQDSRVLYTFIPIKSFGQLSDIPPQKSIFSKTFNSEFSYVWFTDQNSKPLEVEDKINITLVVNQSVTYKKWCAIYSVQPRDRIFVKGCGFLSFAK